MKKLLFLKERLDKYDLSIKYEEGKTYEFEDKRADEILAAGVAKLVVENVENNVEKEEVKEEKPKRKRNTKKD